MVKLYFESAAILLTPENRNVQVPQNPAGAIPVVVRELLKGATNPAFACGARWATEPLALPTTEPDALTIWIANENEYVWGLLFVAPPRTES